MSGSAFYDATAAIQVIGCCFNNPSLLDPGMGYTLTDTDFINDFHRVVFASIANLHMFGAEKIGIKTIEDYLQKKPKSLAIYKTNDGSSWLMKALAEAQPMNFDYYYNRVKKFSLLRGYRDIGVDTSYIYDADAFDVIEREEQEKRLNEMSLQDIADEIENRVVRIKEVIVDNDSDESCQIGDSLGDLVERLKSEPVRGYPLFDKANSLVTMGARLGTFYLRSASTGTGKSRAAMADACFLACGEMWDKDGWVDLGEKIPTVFISVELDKEELQTMALAFISGISEDKILQQDCLDFDEMFRLEKSIKILQESKLFIEYLPDYSLTDIENCIKRNIRVNKTSAIFLDYIAPSMKMMSEMKREAGQMVAREDQALFLLATKIKDIAQKYGVFIYSSTQLSNNFKGERILDQGMLAGAKAIANRVDVGEIMVDMTPEDLEEIQPLLQANPSLGIPNLKMSIYKNRRGKFNRIILWMKASKGTCRYETLFATDYNYTLVDLNKKGE